MKNIELVAGTYEIDSQFMIFNSYLPDNRSIKWIDTAITYNNDWFIGSKSNKFKVISKISPVMLKDYNWWVSNHLKCLNKESIDIMLVHNTRSEGWTKLYEKLLKDNRFKEVGVSNVGINQLKYLKNKFGAYPKYVETEININYIDKELLDFCISNGIKIIAYAILGGKYNAKCNIQNYGLAYNLNLVKKYADMVILRWDNYGQMNQLIKGMKLPVSDIQYKPKLNKSIVPEVYNLPEFALLDSDNFPTYNENISDECRIVTNKNFNLKSKFTILSNPKLEFITEYKAYLRYTGLVNKVCIITEYGNLTKVRKINDKVYIKG